MVQKIILGCGNFGGIGSSRKFLGKGDTVNQARELLEVALSMGISRFDTANTYGAGQSESILGDFFASRGASVRQKVEFHTKVGNPHGIEFGKGALSYQEIMFHIEASLKRLKTDYIDLYILHELDPITPIEESLSALSALIQSGKIRKFGFSNIQLEDLKNFISKMDYKMQESLCNVQNEFNFLNKTDRAELIPFLKSKNISYSAYSPLAGGLLSGKYEHQQNFPEGSRLSLISEPYRKYLNDETFKKIHELCLRADECDSSLAEQALKFIVESPEIDFVVIGPRKKEHYENLGFKF